MNKFYCAVLVLVHAPVFARVFVPQQTYWRYQAFHDPLVTDEKTNTIWAYYAGASAKKGFDCAGKKSSADLTDIFFNKANFYPSDLFNNPSGVNALFAPRFTYHEQGIDIGYYGSYKINDHWSWGFLAELPIKQIHIKTTQVICPCAPGCINFFGNPLDSVFQEVVTTSGDQSYTTFAYRLDFLSKLPYSCTGVGLEYPLTVYADGDFVNLPVTFSNVDATDANNNPVTVLYAQPGSLPSMPYALAESLATTAPVLAADGSQTGSVARERFAGGVNYTPLSMNSANQAQWWVVPTLMTVPGGQTTVYPARVIRTHVDEVVGCYAAQAETIFTAAGINFCSQKMVGIGDLVTQCFVTYHTDSWWGLRLRGGVIFPTGKRASRVQEVFKQPIGNNGHYELQVGGEFLIDIPLFSAMVYFLESHAFKTREAIAPAFLDNCIKNIGPCCAARIGWDSVTAGFLADVHAGGLFDLLFGYKAFIKSHDAVSYTKNYASTIAGTVQQLDPHVAALKSARQLHNLQTQLQVNLWRGLRIDGGVEYTFAGNTAPALVQWNFGLGVLF